MTIASGVEAAIANARERLVLWLVSSRLTPDERAEYLRAADETWGAVKETLGAWIKLEELSEQLIQRNDALTAHVQILSRGLLAACAGWESLWRSDNNSNPPAAITALRKLVTP